MDFESYFYSQDEQNLINDELMGFYGKERQEARLKKIKEEQKEADELAKKFFEEKEEYYF